MADVVTVPQRDQDASQVGDPRTIGRNMFALFTTQAATWIVGGVMLSIAPRYFGDVAYGKFAFATTYVGMFGLVGMLGTSTYLIKSTARNPSSVGSGVLNALYLKTVLGIMLALLAVTLGVALDYDAVTLQLLVAASVAMALGLLNDVLNAGLQGLERMSRPAIWLAVQQYCAAALGLLVIVLKGGVVAYAAVLAPAALIPIVANLKGLRGHLPQRLKPDFAMWKHIAVGGLPYLAWSAVLLVYGSVDILMLKPMAGDATVGWYAVAYKWIGIPSGVAATVLVALLPSLSALGQQINDDFCRLVNRALRLVVLLSFPTAVGLALVASDLFGLIYGGEFGQSIALLQILAFSIPLVVIDMMLGIVLIASDKQRQWVIVGGIAAILNPALNLIAIPVAASRYGNGAIGAASVTVLTEFVMMFGAFLLKPPGVLDRSTLTYIVRCAIAVAAMAVAVTLFGTQPLIVQVFVGVLTYIATSWLLRTLRKEDLNLVRSQLKPKRT